ncbi:MAG: 23S rRNA (uracil(1939)-C(5))-methyltransferase RlmD [Chlamydiales bacterium]
MLCEDMVEPKCKHFGSCGGCRFQHLPYNLQLEQKEEQLRTLFPAYRLEPILGCEEEWRWRNKMEFSFSQAKCGERFLGLMMRGKRGRVITLKECYLTDTWFVDALQKVYQWWEGDDLEAYFPPANRGHLRTLTFRHGIQSGEKMAMLTISGELTQEQEEGFVACLPDFHSLILRTQMTQKGVPTRFEEKVLQGRGYIFETLGDFCFKIRGSSFFQPNTLQAERLYQKIFELANFQKDEILLDLYCGTGTIGIWCAHAVKRVVGVELNKEAILDAQENISLNEISNMEVLEGDVEKIFEMLPFPDVVIVDPPRAGLSAKTVKELLLQGAKKIIYVSCNPRSQAQDIAQLEERYIVEGLFPVDQFPQTPHVENIAMLSLKVI